MAQQSHHVIRIREHESIVHSACHTVGVLVGGGKHCFVMVNVVRGNTLSFARITVCYHRIVTQI
jgi:hypothetical protein